VKELLKSDSICQSHAQMKHGPVFCICVVAAGFQCDKANYETSNNSMYNLNNDNISDDGTTTDGSEIEASECPSDPLLATSGSTPVQVKSPAEFYVPWCGVVFYAMAFTGLCSAWLLRACLSVVIVAMVNQTAVVEDVVITNASEGQCTRDPELRPESGEYNWNRNQQGMVLSAFYFGREVTQVLCIVCIPKATKLNT